MKEGEEIETSISSNGRRKRRSTYYNNPNQVQAQKKGREVLTLSRKAWIPSNLEDLGIIKFSNFGAIAMKATSLSGTEMSRWSSCFH